MLASMKIGSKIVHSLIRATMVSVGDYMMKGQGESKKRSEERTALSRLSSQGTRLVHLS